MINWLSNSANNYTFTWGVTVALFGAVLGIAAFAPGYVWIALMAAVWLSLAGWNWYYEDWIENCLSRQPREVLGLYADRVRLRLALAGAGTWIGLIWVVALASGKDPASTSILIAFGLSIAAVPASFFNRTAQWALLKGFQEVWQMPFNLAIFWMGLTTDEDMLDAKFKTINANGMRFFAAVTGYQSLLTPLHDTDVILNSLPTRA